MERTWEQDFSVPVEALYNWHTRPGALQRLLPPWEHTRINRHDGIQPGGEAHLTMHMGPLRLPWIARHEILEPNQRMVDVQVRGPFAAWRHEHIFQPTATGSHLTERVQYKLPIGGIAGKRAIARRLDRMFQFRMTRMAQDLERHASAVQTQRIGITGATGFLGTGLSAFLQGAGHDVVPLSRANDPPCWNPESPRLDAGPLDSLIHLAGAPIGVRWTPKAKARAMDSRREGTRNLAIAAASLDEPPKSIVSASAVGWYGDTGDEPADESDPPGEGFLAEVVAAWEESMDPARDAGIRVVHPRIGVVLSPHGGALKQMMTPFKFGLGGPVGNGKQWLPWIGYDDTLYAINHLLNSNLEGPVNVVAPKAVRFGEFAKVLGRVMRRPAIAPLPAFVVKAMFGQMGKEVLLAGQRLHPERLRGSGFEWQFDELEPCLRFLLGRQ